MKTIVKYAILIITAVVMMSCKMDFNFNGIKGNGQVTTSTRITDQSFSSIKASEGLEVVLTQSSNTLVKVQADSNLHEYILTEIKDGVLHLHTEKQLGSAEAKKVIVHFTQINSIKSSSGSDVTCTNKIDVTAIHLDSSSGSSMDLNIHAKQINCSSSSGSDIDLHGKTNTLIASASSGSSIDADQLVAQQCTSKASSGASIDVNCIDKIDAKASSGAHIEYDGQPKNVAKSKSSGGSISSK